MSSLEKELSFFNNKVVDTKVESNLEETIATISLSKVLPVNSFLANFRDKYKVNASSFLLTSSFILGILGILASIFFIHGSFAIFFLSIFSSILVTFYLFSVAHNLSRKEANLHSRLLYKKYVEDIEYVVNLFEKKIGKSVRYEFSNGYNAELFLYVNVNGSEHKLHTFYLHSLDKSHPADWLRRMEWSYEDILQVIEEDGFKDKLLQIKQKDKDLWFSLSSSPNKEEVLTAYNKLFSKVVS